jgi:glycosyltransferase involved in cell wall biosynthesis
MKILISLPILLTGGTEIQTFNLVKVLNDAGYSVSVICYYEYQVDMVMGMGAVGAEVILLKLQRLDGLLNLCKNLVRNFKRLKPDIVHVQYVAPGLVPIVAARIAGVKSVIATVHQPGRTYSWKDKFFLKLGAKLCNAFFCVSKSAEESWFGNSEVFDGKAFRKGRKHFTIYNAVDIEEIARHTNSDETDFLRHELGLPREKIIGFVGRLRFEKGAHLLLDAFCGVLQKIPNALLLVVGDGPDKKKLEQQAFDLGITDRIVWLGQKNQIEVFRLYGAMDVVAMPSIFEGFGLAAAEAMAAGVPVVVSGIDGLREVVGDEGAGVLVEPGNTSALADQLVELLNRPEKRAILSSLGKQRVKNYFSFTEFRKRILSAYKMISEER